MAHNYLIGCSGYYYPMWKNKFYPKEIQPKNWLAYYSTIFNSVELNGTFYRTPKLSDLQKYAQVTSATFKFSVKMSKYITHIIKLKDSKQSIHDFQHLILEGLSDKLAHFLFQLPPSFHYNEENLERIISNIPHQPNNIIEFRHISWWNDNVKTVLKNANITFCNVDFPGLKTEIVSTSPIFYLRLHGNPELFKSSYTEEELRSFHALFPNNCSNYAVYFNNTYYEAGYTNALQLKEICRLD
ncbi:MAG TPA: DUF72 domain-containing protein [Bacteroidia bacterium]|nr:DUF72 domain-containing protein [Bacteroidia bacterium]